MLVEIIGTCNNCGSLCINDGISDKFVPSKEWLTEQGITFTESEEYPRYIRICDACVNHYRVDYCQCGSGEPFSECECGCQVPMYSIGGMMPDPFRYFRS